MGRSSTRWGLRRRIAVTGLAAAAMTAAALAVAPGAVATGLLSTSTAVSATPSSSTEGTAVTLKATVKVLGLGGLGVTPKGSVTFTSSNGSATAVLGSAVLSPCLLSSCTATLVTSSIPVGTTSVKATYPGDAFTRPSSGSAIVLVIANSSPGSSATVVCYAGQPCDTGTITSSSGNQTLDVSTPASASNQAVSGSLSAGQLHCQIPLHPDNDTDEDDGFAFPGDLATFSSTATDVGKTIRYTGTSTLGTFMRHEYSEHTLYVGCFGAPHPFNGYSNGVYGPAPFVAADGLYEAQLSNCANNSGSVPCFTNVAGSGTTDTYVITAAAGDPKFIG